MISTLMQRVDRMLWGDSLQKYGVTGRLLQSVLRYVFALGRDMVSGQLTLRAMSLVYTTLLSIVPLIAFSFSVLKGFGVHKDLEPYLFNFLAPLGEEGAEITRQIIELVDRVEGGILGGISLAFFIYTAITMVQKVDESFNFVWHVAKPRNFATRLAEYMIVLLIGPVLITIALGMIASLQSTSIVQFFLGSDWLGPLFVATNKLTPYLIVAAVFTFLYIFVPNTRVRLRSAIIGGVTGGFIWASISLLFATFVVYSTTRLAIYSGFAVAITTLIWLYMNWLILLIGAQLAFYHQNPQYLPIGRREPRLCNLMREKLALNIMLLVGRAFRHANVDMSVQDLSSAIEVPSNALEPIISSLEDRGLLTSTEGDRLLPGREVTRIFLDDILAAVRAHGDTGSYRDPRWAPEVEALGRKVENAVTETTGNRTLADLVDEAEASARGDSRPG